MKKRFFLQLLVLVMLVTLLAPAVCAAPATPACGVDAPQLPSVPVPQISRGIAPAEEGEYITLEEAIVYTREQMSQCRETITFSIKAPNGPDMDTYLPGADFWTRVFAHTGVPTQGDYLFRSLYLGADMSGSGYAYQGYAVLTYQIHCRYRTTTQQEQALDREVEQLLDSLDLNCKTDYQKILAIYDYMTANIYYDYEGLYDPSDELKYTAYGALMEKSSVCQGYATLLYRLALECGVDSRVIAGIGYTAEGGGGHAWNIVKLGDACYNLDATWDATLAQASGSYGYFLRSPINFLDHQRDGEFDTAAFHMAYPMDQMDFDTSSKLPVSHEAAVVPGVDPTCTEDGLTEGRVCAQCGTVLEAQQRVPAPGHMGETIPAVAPTCVETGLTEGKVCAVCGEVLVKQEVVGLTDHQIENGVCTICGAGEPAYTLGDVDDNGRIETYDALKILYHINGRSMLSETELLAANVVGEDETVDVWDVLQIIYFINHRIDHL